MPPTVAFRPKWQIALAQIHGLHREAVPLAPVVADAAYGGTLEFRAALTAQHIPYVLGVREDTVVWPPGYTPRPPRRRFHRGRPPTRLRGTVRQSPVRLATLVNRLPPSAWSTVTWREGTRGRMRSRFVALRVQPAPARFRTAPRPVEWLLSEWPLDDPAGHDAPHRPRPTGPPALAHRARLPGAEGRVWSRPLRRPRLARLPPPWRALHCGLCLPGGRARAAIPP